MRKSISIFVAWIALFVATGGGAVADATADAAYDLEQVRRYLHNSPVMQPIIKPRNLYDQLETENSAGFFMLYCTSESAAAWQMCRAFISGYAQAWSQAFAHRKRNGQVPDMDKCAALISYDALLAKMENLGPPEGWTHVPPGGLIGQALFDLLTEGGCVS